MRLPRALRHRNYRLFFGGQGVSLLGVWLQLTAQAWLMLQLTGSAAAVAVLTLAQQGPGLLLGPFGGAFADRHDRRRLLVLSQSVAVAPALMLGLLTLFGQVEPWQIVLLALVTGLTRAIEIPARQAILADIVGLDDLPGAIGLNSALFNGARLIGPPLAGAITVAAGAAWCFLANGVSYAAIIAALLALRLPAKPVLERVPATLLGEIREGLAYAARQRKIRALFLGLAVSSFAGMSYSVLLPSFAKRVLAGGAGTFGMLQGAIGAGAISSALVLASRGSAHGLERWVIGAAGLFGCSLVVLSRMSSLVPSLVALFLVGTGLMIQAAATNTLVQFTVPDGLRGRVMSLHTSIFLGGFPIGGLIAGPLADRFGEAPVMAAGGSLVVVGALVMAPPLLRSRSTTLDDPAPPATPAPP
jgi:MFS family permease